MKRMIQHGLSIQDEIHRRSASRNTQSNAEASTMATTTTTTPSPTLVSPLLPRPTALDLNEPHPMLLSSDVSLRRGYDTVRVVSHGSVRNITPASPPVATIEEGEEQQDVFSVVDNRLESYGSMQGSLDGTDEEIEWDDDDSHACGEEKPGSGDASVSHGPVVGIGIDPFTNAPAQSVHLAEAHRVLSWSEVAEASCQGNGVAGGVDGAMTRSMKHLLSMIDDSAKKSPKISQNPFALSKQELSRSDSPGVDLVDVTEEEALAWGSDEEDESRKSTLNVVRMDDDAQVLKTPASSTRSIPAALLSLDEESNSEDEDFTWSAAVKRTPPRKQLHAVPDITAPIPAPLSIHSQRHESVDKHDRMDARDGTILRLKMELAHAAQANKLLQMDLDASRAAQASLTSALQRNETLLQSFRRREVDLRGQINTWEIKWQQEHEKVERLRQFQLEQLERNDTLMNRRASGSGEESSGSARRTLGLQPNGTDAEHHDHLHRKLKRRATWDGLNHIDGGEKNGSNSTRKVTPSDIRKHRERYRAKLLQRITQSTVQIETPASKQNVSPSWWQRTSPVEATTGLARITAIAIGRVEGIMDGSTGHIRKSAEVRVEAIQGEDENDVSRAWSDFGVAMAADTSGWSTRSDFGPAFTQFERTEQDESVGPDFSFLSLLEQEVSTRKEKRRDR